MFCLAGSNDVEVQAVNQSIATGCLFVLWVLERDTYVDMFFCEDENKQGCRLDYWFRVAVVERPSSPIDQAASAREPPPRFLPDYLSYPLSRFPRRARNGRR